MSQDEKITRRLDNVEIALSHLQNDYEALNETLLMFTNKFEQLRSHLERLTEKIDLSSEEPNASPKIEDEKPPHY